MTQVGASNKNHIDGELNPMYGSITGLGKNECPDVKMGHLAALVAIKIVHDGGEGPIVIRDAEFSVPEIKDEEGVITQDALPIVGDCEVTFSNETPTVTYSDADGAVTSFSTKVSLKVSEEENSAYGDVTLASKGDYVTLYAAVRPFNASGKKVTIKVNGSSREYTLPANTIFESGKVKTLRVPVKAPKKTVYSDAFDLTSEGRVIEGDNNTHIVGDVLTMSNYSELDVYVNGEPVQAYVLGQANETGSITITGFLKDLINAIPAGFYISKWNNEPSAMTVGHIKGWLPQYNSEQETGGDWDTGNRYDETEGRVYDYWTSVDTKTTKTTYDKTILKRANHPLFAALAGLAGPSEYLELSGRLLLNFAESLKSQLPFKGMPSQGYYENSNTVMMNDDFSHKSIEESNINNFMSTWGITVDDIKQIFEIPQEDFPDNITRIKEEKATNRWKQGNYTGKVTIESSTPFENYPKYTYTPAWPPANDSPLSQYPDAMDAITTLHNILMQKEILSINIGDLIAPTPYHLIDIIRESKVSIEIVTTEDGPRVVLWGIDATLPSEMAQ